MVYDRTFHMSLLTGWALPASQPRVSVIVSPPSRDLPASEHKFLSIKRLLLKRAYKAATSVLCVSSEVADDAAAYYGLPRERFSVLHNPVDVATVRQRASEPVDAISRQSPGNGFTHSLVGRFTAEKVIAWPWKSCVRCVTIVSRVISVTTLRAESICIAWAMGR